jgi:hypothetical protein
MSVAQFNCCWGKLKRGFANANRTARGEIRLIRVSKSNIWLTKMIYA